MQTSLRRGNPKIFLTRTLSMPSMGHVSYPSARIASMKWAAERAVLLWAHTRMSAQPMGSLGVGLVNALSGNHTRLTHANTPWVYAILVIFRKYWYARSGVSPRRSNSSIIHRLLRFHRSGRATNTNSSGAVDAAGWPKQASTKAFFLSRLETRCNSQH